MDNFYHNSMNIPQIEKRHSRISLKKEKVAFFNRYEFMEIMGMMTKLLVIFAISAGFVFAGLGVSHAQTMMNTTEVEVSSMTSVEDGETPVQTIEPSKMPDSSQGAMSDQHHMSYNGMCAPGFASLDGLCVLDDRCGPGVYAGKVCVMDGVMKEYLRPMQQKHAGITADHVICAEGKQLLFKSSDATPVCINSQSVEKLVQRGGWQSEKPPIACTMEWNPVCGVDGNTYGNLCGLNAEHMALKHNGECTPSP